METGRMSFSSPDPMRRRGFRSKAQAALLTQVEDERDVQVDYRAGHIYWSSDLTLIGKIMKRTTR